MQTIIGSTGSIGIEIAKEIQNYTDKVRLVSRNPKLIVGNEELFKADALNFEEINNAVKGSKIVYLTIGLPYKIKIWQEQWELIMDNVIRACIHNNSKLVFFDNIYMYGKVDGKMTEESPVNPISKKGEVRAKISEKLLNEIKKGNIKALIARSADFYGISDLSVPYFLVFNKLKNGKKAQWLGDANKIHSFTYIPDAGKATALLGNSEDAYGEIWHLPTDNQKITGKEFIEKAAKYLNTEPKFSNLNPFMVKIGGLFDSTIKELNEMMYQNMYDYYFDSSKFDNKFKFNKITYDKGIKEIADSFN